MDKLQPEKVSIEKAMQILGIDIETFLRLLESDRISIYIPPPCALFSLKDKNAQETDTPLILIDKDNDEVKVKVSIDMPNRFFNVVGFYYEDGEYTFAKRKENGLWGQGFIKIERTWLEHWAYLKYPELIELLKQEEQSKPSLADTSPSNTALKVIGLLMLHLNKGKYTNNGKPNKSQLKELLLELAEEHNINTYGLNKADERIFTKALDYLDEQKN